MKLKYLAHYPEQTQTQVVQLIESGNLAKHLLKKYPKPHTMKNDKTLFNYVMSIKNEYIKKSPPLSKTHYDGKINVIHNAL